MSERRAVGLVLAIVVLFQCEAQAQPKTQLSIGLSEMPPLTVSGSSWTGIYPDLLRELFKGTDYGIVFKRRPYRRSLQEIVAGQLDLITFAAGDNIPLPSQFDNAVDHGNTIYKLDVALFYDTKKNPYLEWSTNSLKNKVIAMPKQYDAYNGNQRYLAMGLVLEPTSSSFGMFKMLGLGRVDLVYAVDLVGLSVLEKLYPGRQNDFALLYQDVSIQTAIKLGISKKVHGGPENLRRQINHSLRRMLQSGKYLAIKKSHYPAGRPVLLESIPYAEYGVTPPHGGE